MGKTKPLSIIIAGATGSTGQHLVAKLVSHPRVDRVVALSRIPVPVDRWNTAFPGIRMADALRHLSVVEMDYERLQRDAQGVQQSLTSSCDIDDVAAQIRMTETAENQLWSSISNECNEKDSSGGCPMKRVCCDYYYRSVFMGHHIAINCLGTHELLFGRGAAKVDLNYSLAFATMVRLFDTSVVGAVDLAEEEGGIIQGSTNKAVQQANQRYNDVWREVYAACLGERYRGQPIVVEEPPAGPCTKPADPTLELFVQMSANGANPSSFFPYFRAHGQRDKALGSALSYRCAEGDKSCVEVVIWRPGLLGRSEKTRWIERALATLLPPFEVDSLTDLIVEDVVARVDSQTSTKKQRSRAVAHDDMTILNSLDIEALEQAKAIKRTIDTAHSSAKKDPPL